MESQELIDAFRAQLDQVEAQGNTQLQVSAIRSYLSALEKDTGESQEQRKLQHAGMLAQYAAKSGQAIEMFKSVLEAGKSALQALIFINGGAVVALLGVMSALAAKAGGATFARYLALPLLEFGIGVLCGALGFAFRYFSQACYASAGEETCKVRTWGHYFRALAVLSALAGYLLFGFAIANSYHAVLWSFPL